MERKSLSASAVLTISHCTLTICCWDSWFTLPPNHARVLLTLSAQYLQPMSTNSGEVSSQSRSHEMIFVCFEFRFQTPSQIETLFCLVTILGDLVYIVDSANDQMFFFFSAPEWAGSIECSCQPLVHWLYLELWKRPRRRGRTPTFPILQSECSQLSQIVHIFFFLSSICRQNNIS